MRLVTRIQSGWYRTHKGIEYNPQVFQGMRYNILCQSEAGVRRRDHSWDKDGRCIFCSRLKNQRP